MTRSRMASAGRCRRRSARCRGRRRGNCRRRSTSQIRGTAQIRSRRIRFPQPTTVLTVESGMRPPYAQKWNFCDSAVRCGSGYLVDVRYIGTKGTRLPRMIEANPAVYGPGATADNADQRRLYAGCHAPGAALRFRLRGPDHRTPLIRLITPGRSRSRGVSKRALASWRRTRFRSRSTMFRASMLRAPRPGWSPAKTILRRTRSI